MVSVFLSEIGCLLIGLRRKVIYWKDVGSFAELPGMREAMQEDP